MRPRDLLVFSGGLVAGLGSGWLLAEAYWQWAQVPARVLVDLCD